MKRVIGIAILLVVFGLLFALTTAAHGWMASAVAWGVAIVLATLIVAAVKLIYD